MFALPDCTLRCVRGLAGSGSSERCCAVLGLSTHIRPGPPAVCDCRLPARPATSWCFSALAGAGYPPGPGIPVLPGAPALPGQALALEAAAERLRVVVGREASEAYAREAAVVVVEGEVEEGSLWLLRRMKLGTKLIGIGTGRIPGWTVSRSTFLRMAWDGNAEVCMCRKG